MLKNLEELGIGIIKCKDNNKTEEVKELQYAANELLFPYLKNYLTPTQARSIAEKLTSIGVQLTKIPAQSFSAISCIQDSLRPIIRTLKAYVKDFSWDVEDEEKLQKRMNYLVVQYLKAKRTETLDGKKILHLLEDWKTTFNFLISPNVDRYPNLNTDAFMSMRKELLQLFVSLYS